MVRVLKSSDDSPALKPDGRRITGLFRYPIKSCRGEEIEMGEVGRRGFLGDRDYMVVDSTGKFLTQRELPRMALIEPRLLDGMLAVSAPGMSQLSVRQEPYGPRVSVRIWKDTCEASDQGDDAARWFSDYLNVDCRLAFWRPSTVREVDQDFAPPGAQVGFADGYPFLLALETSLTELNRRLPEPFLMNRFRPSIVVDGLEPFEEDHWKSFRASGIEFQVVKPCARCPITTVDQATAERGKEPLRTLATFRRVQGKGVMFGQNLVHSSTGELRRGSAIQVAFR